MDIRKVKPKTEGRCINCKLRVDLRPMGSIDVEDVYEVKGICIRCGAGIQECPEHATYFDDEHFL